MEDFGLALVASPALAHANRCVGEQAACFFSDRCSAAASILASSPYLEDPRPGDGLPCELVAPALMPVPASQDPAEKEGSLDPLGSFLPLTEQPSFPSPQNTQKRKKRNVPLPRIPPPFPSPCFEGRGRFNLRPPMR